MVYSGQIGTCPMLAKCFCMIFLLLGGVLKNLRASASDTQVATAIQPLWHARRKRPPVLWNIILNQSRKWAPSSQEAIAAVVCELWGMTSVLTLDRSRMVAGVM